MLQRYLRPRTTTPRRSSTSKTHLAYTFPCQNMGLDISQSLPQSDPRTALRLENFVTRSLGLELRPGFTRWMSNLGGEVRTLMPYIDQDGTITLFGASSNGSIYNVTLQQPSSFTPTAVLTDTNAEFDGEWNQTVFVNPSGVTTLCITSAGAGYYTWDGTTWTHHIAGGGAGQINGTNPAEFDFVIQWKGRLWFVPRDSSSAWYLPTGQIAGTVTEFDFGPFFPHGGSIAGMVSWTVDSGSGVDDKLVIISTQGDILIYGGTDPDFAATFLLDGTWYIGKVPVGRRFFTQFAGDISILCERGMVFLSEILRGQGMYGNAATAARVNAEIARAVTATGHQRYWEVRFIPSEQLIVINQPSLPSGEFQWIYEVNAKGFSTLTGIPMLTIQSFNGLPFFGDDDGNVWLAFSGSSDGIVDDESGTDLEGVIVGAFVALGDPVQLKRFLMVRPQFIADASPGVAAQLNPDWVLNIPSGAPPYMAAGSSLWDLAIWDLDVWAGSQNNYGNWLGAVGTGRYASLAMRIKGSPRSLFVAYTIVAEPGGIL